MHYSDRELWVLIALLTLGSRSFFVPLPRRWQPRGRVQQTLRYASLAALLAINVPVVAKQLPHALQQFAPVWALATDARLVSAVVLVLVTVIRLTRHTLWGLLAGIVSHLFGAGAVGALSGFLTEVRLRGTTPVAMTKLQHMQRFAARVLPPACWRNACQLLPRYRQ